MPFVMVVIRWKAPSLQSRLYRPGRCLTASLAIPSPTSHCFSGFGYSPRGCSCWCWAKAGMRAWDPSGASPFPSSPSPARPSPLRGARARARNPRAHTPASDISAHIRAAALKGLWQVVPRRRLLWLLLLLLAPIIRAGAMEGACRDCGGGGAEEVGAAAPPPSARTGPPGRAENGTETPVPSAARTASCAPIPSLPSAKGASTPRTEGRPRSPLAGGSGLRAAGGSRCLAPAPRVPPSLAATSRSESFCAAAHFPINFRVSQGREAQRGRGGGLKIPAPNPWQFSLSGNKGRIAERGWGRSAALGQLPLSPGVAGRITHIPWGNTRGGGRRGDGTNTQHSARLRLLQGNQTPDVSYPSPSDWVWGQD